MPKIDLRNIESVINPVYRPYLNRFDRVQVYKGGGSAGKSRFICQRHIYHLLATPGYNLLVLRKVAATNHDSTFAELNRVINSWGMGELFKINETSGKETITALPTGNKIIFKGTKDPTEREKAKGVTFATGDLACIWMEEASEFNESDYNQMTIRTRGAGKVPKHIILSFNPIDKDSWLKGRFFDREIKNGFILETTYKDNNFLTPDDVEMLESYKEIDNYYYMVYCLNQWGDISNARVFQNIEIHDFDTTEHFMSNIRHGLDFGFVHAQALMGTGYKEGELYVFREFYEKGMDNIPFIDQVYNSSFPIDYPIAADSANPDKIVQWQQRGFMISASKKGPGSFKIGIDYLRTLPKIHIHATNCPNAAREFPKFKRRELSDGTITDHQYVELDDDTIAAIRYANEEFFIGGINQKPRRPFNRGVM